MNTKIIAHRGASKYAPENTLPAFQLAYEMKADGIEFDVHLTKDEVPVIIHDERLNRTTNGKGFVRDYTFSELEQFDCGSWFSPKFSETKILSLEQLLHWVRSKPLFINIELKNNKYDYPNLETIVYKLISQYNLIDRICFSTFNPNSIKRLNELNEHIQIAYLTSKNIPNLIDYTMKLGANALHVHQRLIKRSLVKNAHEKSLPLRVYTVNKPLSLIRMKQKRLDGIITDVPDIAKKYTTFFTKK